ncbi:MAG: Secretion system C-terminal sorting domain [Bacteroidota bacterium]|jgi:hypothetical protein
MKVLLILFLTCCFAVNSSAQLWSPEGAIWHHSFFSNDLTITNNNGYMTTSYYSDTLINGESCKVLLQVHNDVAIYDTLYTQETDSVVYIYNEQTSVFDTLFNYKANIGASWKIPGVGSTTCGTQGIVTVANKGYSIINGFNLLWLKIDVDFDPQDNFNFWNYSDTIFQRFGTNGLYFMPFSYCENNLELESIIGFRCYEDKDFSNLNVVNFDCDSILVVGFEEFNKDVLLPFSIYPNPINGHFAINGQFSKNDIISILSTEGRVVQTINIIEQADEQFIDLDLNSGIYLLQITSALGNFCEQIRLE